MARRSKNDKMPEQRFESLYPGVELDEYPGAEQVDWSANEAVSKFLACDSELAFLQQSAASLSPLDEAALYLHLGPVKQSN